MSVKSEKVSELFDFRRSARTVLDIEKQAIDGLYQYLNDAFDQACEMILRCSGKIVVTGMGKSGHVGSKIAATTASTGTPAFFLHPGEASHGDLGMISGGDLIIAISNSGESDEIPALLPVLKRRGIPLICMTGNPASTMAKEANVHLCIKVEKEACPLGLAPTSSTTATLVMGDALAVALLEARGFTADDFALSHPGGSLGKRLLLRVGDLMHSGELLPRGDRCHHQPGTAGSEPQGARHDGGGRCRWPPGRPVHRWRPAPHSGFAGGYPPHPDQPRDDGQLCYRGTRDDGSRGCQTDGNQKDQRITGCGWRQAPAGCLQHA